MRTYFVATVLLLLILSVSITGCSSVTPTTPTNQLSTKDPSEMALQLSDLPEGYQIQSRGETTRSDVSYIFQDATYGWTKGYSVGFLNSDGTFILHDISIFDIDQMDGILFLKGKSILVMSNATNSVDQLSDPNIGDSSKAYRIKRTIDGQTITAYTIVFTKKDVFEQVIMSGTMTDYEILKNLAKIAAAKIN